ncbi:MAG: TIGR02147 family protein [Bacteriovoracaceae bacterium]
MTQETNMQAYLQDTFHKIKTANPNYSVRAFAKKVGVAPGTLSLVMLGKRNVSHKLARKIADKLMLDPQERSEVLSSYYEKPAKKPQTQNYLQLNKDQFNVIGEWHFFALLNLVKLKSFVNDTNWIAKRLGISEPKAKNALETLKRVGMLKEENGKLKRTAPKYRTTDDVASLALRKSHFQNIELAQESLNNDQLQERDFTWITFNMKKEKMAKAKELIRKFQDDFMELVEDEQEGDEVFRMAMQLFQLTKTGE